MRTALALLGAPFLCCAALAQPPAAKSPPGFPDAPGKETLVAKCFQCHGPNMWMPLRQDRRAWESTLYRMVGRGALWTEAEIKAMADYLGVAYGKGSR
jgi:mono/diheme cytochrome c family protein